MPSHAARAYTFSRYTDHYTHKEKSTPKSLKKQTNNECRTFIVLS